MSKSKKKALTITEICTAARATDTDSALPHQKKLVSNFLKEGSVVMDVAEGLGKAGGSCREQEAENISSYSPLPSKFEYKGNKVKLKALLREMIKVLEKDGFSLNDFEYLDALRKRLRAGARVISKPLDAMNKKYDAFYKSLVPPEGPAKTLEGEVLRACSKLGYRWNNDGDRFYKGYGCETAGPAATYLWKSGIPGLRELIDKAPCALPKRNSEEGRDQTYDEFINAVTSKVVAWIESKNGKYTANDGDFLQTSSRWSAVNEEDEYDDGADDYEEEEVAGEKDDEQG